MFRESSGIKHDLVTMELSKMAKQPGMMHVYGWNFSLFCNTFNCDNFRRFHDNLFEKMIPAYSWKLNLINRHFQNRNLLLLTGHEPHELLWYHPRTAVCIVHCAVLWPCAGSAGIGSAEGQWDGWTTSITQWLPDIPECWHWDQSPNQALFQIHWESAHLFQVSCVEFGLRYLLKTLH